MSKSYYFGRQVAFGFFIVTLILATSVLLTLVKLNSNAEINDRINNFRVPTVRESLLVLSGVNQSIGAFRGWLLFKDNSYRGVRRDAWQDIDRSMQMLKALAEKSHDSENLKNLDDLNNKLMALRNMQDELESSNLKLKNRAFEIASREIAPLALEIRKAAENIVSIQERLLAIDTEESAQSAKSLAVMEWILLLFGVLAASSIGIYLTRAITKPLADTVAASNRIADEDFEFTVNLAGPAEIEFLGAALEKMRVNLKGLTNGLRDKNKILEDQKWQIDGQVALLEQMGGDQNIKGLASNILKFLSVKIGASMGVLYLLENEILTPIEAYAHQSALVLGKTFVLGEGFVGQAAREKQFMHVRDLPSDYFKIHSGLGQTLPRTLIFLPILFDGRVVAILEFAGIQEFETLQLSFLKGTSENIGIAINLSLTSQKTKELLEETQVQAEELQTQQEELKVANEELELKTRSLEASDEELRSQQEELKVTNEELIEQTQLLEREKEILANRTDELEQTKLILESRAKEIEQVSRYKSEFLANMSHELRTPLNSILMLSQSLTENRSNNLTERQLKGVDTIYSSGNDLLSLIEDILDLSKIEAGKMEVRPESISISELFESLSASFEPMAKEGSLRFNIEIENNLPKTIFTDVMRMKQILKNLLSNAFKFTNEGSVTLSAFRSKDISVLSHVSPSNSIIAFAIADTGIGIPDVSKKSVFDAFKQLDAQTTRKYGGTGLGLAIVKELVALLGGEIKLESEEGRGTRVTVFFPESYHARLPVSTPTHEAVAVLNPVRSLAAIGTPVDDDRHLIQPSDAVVLIVEDDVRFASTLLDLCRENGFKGIILNDGISAFKFAEELAPKGILLDLGLPELDGTGVLKLLKENPKTRHIPIQVITGHDRKKEVLLEGAMGFLKKPAKREDLTNVLKKMHSYSQQQGESRVLVVEDDRVQRESIREYIAIPGVSILEAETGAKGLQILKTERIDCIILDLKLPDITGREFLQQAKAAASNELPPVIIYTGKDLSDAELKELEGGSKSIIVKGVKSSERLFDETMMFLHRLQKEIPDEKKKVVENLHNPTRILKGKSILVVDDDSRNIHSLTHLLEDHGVLITVAENGVEALAKLEKAEKVDLVLLDMMMPEMDGYEAVRRIRENPKFRQLPVVALTARAMKGEREKCLEAGCNDYLTKPIENAKLISLLRVWLYGRT